MEFLILQIAQQMAARPIIWIFLWAGINLLAQTQYWFKEAGLQSAPITIETRLQQYLATTAKN